MKASSTPEMYFRPWQAHMIEGLMDIVNGWMPFTIFRKNFNTCA